MGNLWCSCRPSRHAVDADCVHSEAGRGRVSPLQSWGSDTRLNRRSKRISADGGDIPIEELSRSITDQFDKAGIGRSPPPSSGYASFLVLDSEYSTMDSTRGCALLRKQYSGSEYSSYNSQSGNTLKRRFRSNSRPVPEDPSIIPTIHMLRKSAADSQNTEQVEQMKRGLHPEHASTLKHHFRYLKDELDPEVLNDHFITHLMFDEDDLDEIKNEGPRRQQMDLLLRKLLRCCPSWYDTFLIILGEAEYSYVRDKLVANAPPSELAKDDDFDLEDIRDRIFNNYELLVDQLEPRQILDFYIVYEVMDMDVYEDIIGEKSRKAKAEALVEFIESHLQTSADSYYVLVTALKDDEIGGQYLLHKLSEKIVSDDNPQGSETGATSTVNVKLEFGRCASSKHSRGDTIAIILKLKKIRNCRHKERRLLGELRQYIPTLNDRLIPHIGYHITHVEIGSIVIYLQECSTAAFEKFKTLCTNGGLAGVLETVFSQPKVSQYLPKQTVVSIKVSQQEGNTIKSASRTKDNSSLRDNLMRNRPYFMEELDALRFVKGLQERDVLTVDEIDTLLHEQPVSRRHRLSRMFQILLDKGDSAIQGFVEVLKGQNKEELVKRLDPSSVPAGFLEDDDDLLKNYVMLVEEMSPRELINDARGRGVLKSTFELPRDQGRRGQAMHVLQHVLKADSDTKKVFCQILQDNGYTMFLSSSSESETVSSENAPAFSRNVCSTAKLLPPDTIFTGKVLIRREEKDLKSNIIPEEALRTPQPLSQAGSAGIPVQKCPAARKIEVGSEGKADSGYSSHNDLNNTVSTSLGN